MSGVNLDLTNNCRIFNYINEMLQTAPKSVVNRTLMELSLGIKKKDFKAGKKKFSVNINGDKITVIIDGKVTKTHIRIMMGYLLKHSHNSLNNDCTEEMCPLKQNGICKKRSPI